jgi:hypothetical protein
MTNNDVHHYLPPHLVWEEVGSEVVICDTSSHTTHHLNGDLAGAFLAAVAGTPLSPREVIALQERGFLESRSPVSRRTLIGGSAAGLGIGLTSLSLPTAALASSNKTTRETANSPEPTVQFEPSITKESLAPGDWQWSLFPPTGTPTQLRVQPTNENVGLPTDSVFAAGDSWELSLEGFTGSPVNATVTNLGDDQEPYLILQFSFPLGGGVEPPAQGAQLSGVLTLQADGDPVFSESFPIPWGGSV